MHQVLERAGYTVIAAENGSRALNHLPYHSGPLDLLLTDVVMPDMSGPRLAEQVLERYPSLPIIFLSGYPADAFPPGSNYPERSLFLSKPLSIRSLVNAVESALAADSWT
jgi:CheY-like chemotaxis protein